MTGDQKELRLSLSKTKTYIDCPKKFKFGYIDKLPRKEFEYHIFGKFIHQVLEDFHKTYLDGSTELFHITMKNVYKNALKEYSSKMTSEAKKEAFSLVQKYLSIVSLDPNEVKKTQSVEKKI